MCDRRKDHQKNYDIQYFTVVAVVNEYSILKRQIHDGTYKNAEEYVLTLEKRLIESFMKAECERPRLLNETTETGGTTKDKKAGYVVYIAAAISSKFIFTVIVRYIVY